MVQKCQGFKNLDGIDTYSRLVKSFLTTYKRMENTRPNASSLPRRVPKVESENKVRKVTDGNLELISKTILKSIPKRIIRIKASYV